MASSIIYTKDGTAHVKITTTVGGVQYEYSAPISAEALDGLVKKVPEPHRGPLARRNSDASRFDAGVVVHNATVAAMKEKGWTFEYDRAVRKFGFVDVYIKYLPWSENWVVVFNISSVLAPTPAEMLQRKSLAKAYESTMEMLRQMAEEVLK